MAKSVLTLDEINLLKNSEEPQNTELYGNLYEVICQLDNPRAVSLEQLQKLDNTGIAALTYNKKALIDTVIKEWYSERVSGEDSTKKVKCGLCNTPNKYLYYIRNRKNNKLLNVGSSCITKFPGIEGYIEQKRQLSQIQKEHSIIKRRNEFYKAFPDCEKVISDADKYFDTLPVLLTFDLYTKLKTTITQLRLIYTKYVNEGKTPFKSEHNSFELFRTTVSDYNQLKIEADDHVSKIKNNPLACKRAEIDWLNTNDKLDLLKQIAENNGIYTLNTLKCMSSLNFVKDNLSTILEKNRSNLFRFNEFNGNNIIFSFNKYGYQPAITFSASLSDFMNVIGANCIIYENYTFGSEEILKISNIISSMQNLESIIYFTYNIVDKFNYAFLIDYKTNTLLLYRKGDGAIRKFNPSNFLDIYAEHILLSNDKVKKFLFKTIVGRNNVKWITSEMQSKQGIDDKISKLYKEYKDNYIGNSYHNNYNNQFEVITYVTVYDSTTNTTHINFDKPEYITLPRNRIKLGNRQLGLVDYAIEISDDTLEPLYKKGDILLIQNTQNMKDGNIMFFISNDGFNIKECHTENEHENIFQYFHIKRNELQAFGRIVYCFRKI